MVRRYEEPIEVREAAPETSGAPGGERVGGSEVEGAGGSRPDAFVWQGRLYVVRVVLDRWQERRPWWRDVRDHEGSDVLADARERRVWRVEASAGRCAAVGVYDLCAEPGAGRGQWQLLRVSD